MIVILEISEMKWVALEGEGSNNYCFSITQLVRQKKAIIELANAN